VVYFKTSYELIYLLEGHICCAFFSARSDCRRILSLKTRRSYL